MTLEPLKKTETCLSRHKRYGVQIKHELCHTLNLTFFSLSQLLTVWVQLFCDFPGFGQIGQVRCGEIGRVETCDLTVHVLV